MNEVFLYLKQINAGSGYIDIIIRTIIIFTYAITLIRFGNKRYQCDTKFDFILVIILGSVLGRAINGSSTLLEAVVASLVLVMFHWIFSFIALNTQNFGELIKGKSHLLVSNGELNGQALKQNQLTEEDILVSFRESLHKNDISLINEARLERTGKISFILKEPHE